MTISLKQIYITMYMLKYNGQVLRQSVEYDTTCVFSSISVYSLEYNSLDAKQRADMDTFMKRVR